MNPFLLKFLDRPMLNMYISKFPHAEKRWSKGSTKARLRYEGETTIRKRDYDTKSRLRKCENEEVILVSLHRHRSSFTITLRGEWFEQSTI